MTTFTGENAVTSVPGDDAVTLVIGPGPEENRLTDVRVMLPGLMAQHVHHLCLDLRSCPRLTEPQLVELRLLCQSCQDREIDLEFLGLDSSTRQQLGQTCVRTGWYRAEPRDPQHRAAQPPAGEPPAAQPPPGAPRAAVR